LQETSHANPAGDLDALYSSPGVLRVVAAERPGGAPFGRYHDVLRGLNGGGLQLDEIDIRSGNLTAASADEGTKREDVTTVLDLLENSAIEYGDDGFFGNAVWT